MRAEAHISLVSKERNHYKKVCKECKDNVREMFTTDNEYVPPPTTVSQPAMSRDTTMHYSFDMAQQVSLRCFVYNYSHVCITYLPQVHDLSDPL